ncbi:hypothetical protein [Anaerohalosphaera lusitana]|nr:hypothetical protein [Anaerohalosphaera lusitana]
MVFTMSGASYLFWFVYFLAITSPLIFGLTSDNLKGAIPVIVIFAIPCILLISVGFWAFWYYSRPMVFDKRSGLYHRGKLKSTAYGKRQKKDEKAIPLDDIHALQIIPKLVRDESDYCYNYELNMVLKNGDRKNLLNVDRLKHVMPEANRLASFLEIPAWNAVTETEGDPKC